MRPIKIQKGAVFGKLTVIKEVKKRGRDRRFLLKCECGNEKDIRLQSLRQKRTVSCGCVGREALLKSALKHGYNRRGKRTRIHAVWGAMIQRCNNEKNKSFHNYGGRGIKVCKRWLKFENFLEDMGEPPKGLSIERINNDKGYSLQNCKWATPKEQANNKRKYAKRK